MVEVDDVETRQLVCEGPCNPDLREYDQAASRVNRGMRTSWVDRTGVLSRSSRQALDVVCGWGRRLKHTPHFEVKGVHWDVRIGVCRVWECQICGNRRKH